ncbi:MAG: hypothetical protein NTY86_23265, partial [Deltaproteobacteria bacterium]|nr:hypothetical protein [Deltaproteobacteria bacterium]
IETDEKIHLCEGAWTEDDPAKDEGWLLHYPAQARHKENEKGTQEQYSTMSLNFLLIQFLHNTLHIFYDFSGTISS